MIPNDDTGLKFFLCGGVVFVGEDIKHPHTWCKMCRISLLYLWHKKCYYLFAAVSEKEHHAGALCINIFKEDSILAAAWLNQMVECQGWRILSYFIRHTWLVLTTFQIYGSKFFSVTEVVIHLPNPTVLFECNVRIFYHISLV